MLHIDGEEIEGERLFVVVFLADFSVQFFRGSFRLIVLED